MSVPPTPLLIWGAGRHAAVVADIMMLSGQHVIAGFIDDIDPTPRPVLGGSVLGGADAVSTARASGISHAMVGVGDCETRLELSRLLVAEGFSLATAVHPTAVIARSVEIGPGSVIAASAVIGVRAKLGRSVIINTGAIVDHDCVVEDGVHVCPGATLAGGVQIGAGAWIGAGATVADGLTIGARTVVGAGAVVIRSLESGVVAYGVPARPVRPVQK